MNLDCNLQTAQGSGSGSGSGSVYLTHRLNSKVVNKMKIYSSNNVLKITSNTCIAN